ncbi:UDP-N-acetylmuramoyl-L-alanyl-D-glutamate--2,6-diaminopimelate ligase [Vibrio sp. 10N.286.49.B3]|uniref:UDP-N-acetylmuramoyl-L-alanyl-D-glutamate--2, 6-diaminopimelate ligase n=1 Tax=Vibrio sp. 10N.286.49.B3 TaxID=1880855 RepID=UPI000C82E8E3|nr:UDP-N-acetylmuramoyl-L-alanyl-D-glutamate--2,6-diaminopimelate ligase [Vibrio sp. 10N.286.49.B3]PMH39927.1 UDP-N-acetylmuramoyl-L-alanyl-D-glutamate--2,6-diaminopimelate ligase [Vibrio sp. 10N.286.49.B3]
MSHTMRFATLISPWVDISDSPVHNLLISHLELDSRKVGSGDTFVAVIGHAVDGRKFISSALSQGASSVIAEACERNPHGSIEWVDGVAIVYIQELNQHLSALAGRFYHQQASENALIGVTGTNGKTTITQLIAQWLELLDQPAAVMGTTGNGFLDNLQPAANTTGSALEIQHTLSQLSAQGARYTALEISSHGLVQGRIKALSFAAGIFTNLSRDHLDYHGTMEAYAEAKQSLFTAHNCQQAVINIDDEVGLRWLDEVDNAIAVSLAPIATEHKAKHRCLWAEHIDYSEQGIRIEFDGTWQSGVLSTPLIGEFNACNVLLAFATLLSLGYSSQQLMASAAKLQPVLGRMELFKAANKAKVVVDYAHTPDALEKALSALRVHCSGQLWVIVGCGGDRDAGKRPMMASIAEQYADRCILTDDNPRSESAAQIIRDMLAGMTCTDNVVIEHDRAQALQHALAHSGVNDIILLAGKGHEDYQIMQGRTIHYSDRESAQQLLGLSS